MRAQISDERRSVERGLGRPAMALTWRFISPIGELDALWSFRISDFCSFCLVPKLGQRVLVPNLLIST
jgi:hypothetical protein